MYESVNFTFLNPVKREVQHEKHKYKLLTFTALFAIATFIIHVLNKIIAASASLKEMLDTGNKSIYKWRFGKIHYTKKVRAVPFY